MTVTSSMRTIDHDDTCCDLMDVIITDQGLKVCRHCGTVHGSEMVIFPKVAYTGDEIIKRRTHEIFYPHSILPIRMPKSGRYRPKNFNKWLRLIRRNKRTTDRTREYYTITLRTCSSFQIPTHVSITAWRIIQKIRNKGWLRGKSFHDVLIAVIYFSAKINRYPLLIDSICEDGDTKKRVCRNFRIVMKAFDIVYPGSLKKPVVTGGNRIDRRVAELRPLLFKMSNGIFFPMELRIESIKLYETLLEYGFRTGGKNKNVIIGSLLFIVGKTRNHVVTVQDDDGKVSKKCVTQKIIANLADITEVSLRKRIKDIITVSLEAMERNARLPDVMLLYLEKKNRI